MDNQYKGMTIVQTGEDFAVQGIDAVFKTAQSAKIGITKHLNRVAESKRAMEPEIERAPQIRRSRNQREGKFVTRHKGKVYRQNAAERIRMVPLSAWAGTNR